MKYVGIMSWESEDAEKVTEHFKKWKVPDGLKWHSGPYTMLGQNKSVSIMEATDEAWIKMDRYWRHLCTWESYAIVESAKMADIKV
jgi:hypothetical protein